MNRFVELGVIASHRDLQRVSDDNPQLGKSFRGMGDYIRDIAKQGEIPIDEGFLSGFITACTLLGGPLTDVDDDRFSQVFAKTAQGMMMALSTVVDLDNLERSEDELVAELDAGAKAAIQEHLKYCTDEDCEYTQIAREKGWLETSNGHGYL